MKFDVISFEPIQGMLNMLDVDTEGTGDCGGGCSGSSCGGCGGGCSDGDGDSIAHLQ